MGITYLGAMHTVVYEKDDVKRQLCKVMFGPDGGATNELQRAFAFPRRVVFSGTYMGEIWTMYSGRCYKAG